MTWLHPSPVWICSAGRGGSFPSPSAHAPRQGAVWCSMVGGSPSPVPAANRRLASQVRSGCRPAGDHSGYARAEEICWYRGPWCLPKARADDVSPLPLLLRVSVGAAVSRALSWPGASQQNIGFFSKGTVITCNISIIFPIRSGYLQLERISRTLADLTLLTIINPFPFDSNQSLESF